MREAPELLQAVETEQPALDLALLIPRDPWLRVFLHNLRDLFRGSEFGAPQLKSTPAEFWPDVFVDRKLPWPRFAQSGIYHLLLLVAIWQGSQFLALQSPAIAQPAFKHADVIYYTPSEYLPPLDTRRGNTEPARKAEPEYSIQPIISLPPESDNRTQTIVAPPHVRLNHDVALPNIVATLDKAADPRMPIGPAPAVPASEMSRVVPPMERPVIAPPPMVQAASRQRLDGPQPLVIAPPPSMNTAPVRRVGDFNVGRSAVIAPAPQLSLNEQRALYPKSLSLNPQTPQVIAPPPTVGASGGAPSRRGMIALNLHPAIGAPPDPPAGNRRGNFASTPHGHRGASGAPGTSTGDAGGGTTAGNGKSDGSETGKSALSSVPSGLYVGKASAVASPVAGDPASNSTAKTVNPRLLANARSSRVLERAMQPEGESKLSQEERAVFGGRKFYSLSLNMPNLNSAGGSWVIRFAALKPDLTFFDSHAAASSEASNEASSGDLSAPSATRKVDPAYPLELMRQNVGGTVILYAVIHADGTVGGVRVLRSVDDRLDQFASEAIAKWKFQPATKNGAPVDVEATFWIPFRPTRVGSNF
jgi:TonB family protein